MKYQLLILASLLLTNNSTHAMEVDTLQDQAALDKKLMEAGLTAYDESKLPTFLETLDTKDKQNLYDLLFDYKKRVERGDEQGILTQASSWMFSGGWRTSAGGGAIAVPTGIASLVIDWAAMSAAKKAMICAIGYGSGFAFYAGAATAVAGGALVLPCQGYEYLKWRRANNAMKAVRKILEAQGRLPR